MKIEALYDAPTFTLTYLVYDEATRDAVVIDPVLDYDPAASRISLTSYEKLKARILEHGLTLHYVLETHAHADHLSSSQYIQHDFPGVKIGIGAHITRVQEVFKPVFQASDLATDGSQFDQLFQDGEVFTAGALRFQVLFTPGHTPACVSYLIEDAVFTGDALFIEDYGTGRCDFPGGSVEDAYHSIHDVLYDLPDATRVFVGHDYQPQGRPLRYETTIGVSKAENISLRAETAQEDFVRFRSERDSTLAAPRLLLPSVQVNINAGRLPTPEANGVSYLKLPIRS
ncbi:MAG: MBL fold metallo-hydrolase [Candidatus Sericytochromatia bacterium]